MNPPDRARVATERLGAVAVLMLDRPPVNAFDPDLVDRLGAAVAALAGDPSVHCVLIRGLGRHFSAGADVAMLAGVAGSPEGASVAVEHVARMQALFAAVEAIPVPTIAALHGAATGGGFELALACDLRIASTGTRLGLPEVNLGLVPGAGGTQRIARLAGPGVAARIVLTGDLVGAAEAAQLGLVQHVVADDDLVPAAVRIAERIASHPRATLVAAKRCLQAGNADGFGEELVAVRELVASAETAALLTAFVDRRRAPLAG